MGPFIIKLSKYESYTWHRFGAKIAVLFQAKLHNNLRFKRAKMCLGSRPASVRRPCGVRPVSVRSLFESKLHNSLPFKRAKKSGVQCPSGLFEAKLHNSLRFKRAKNGTVHNQIE